MKYTLIMACALSVACMNVQCMDEVERQKLIQEHDRQKKDERQGPPAYQVPPAYVAYIPKPTSANAPLIEHDVEGAINAGGGAVGDPQKNDIYNGTLYGAGTTTFGQFWKVQNIPSEEQYRSGPQLDEYVRDRRMQACKPCIDKTCCCICCAGAVAGVIVGIVYFRRWIDSCDGDPYQDKCDYGYNTQSLPPYSQSQSYTFMTQLLTALVNKSNKME